MEQNTTKTTDTNPLLCEGSCTVHRGIVRPVKCFEPDDPEPWRFNYCDEAVEEDTRRGFAVVEIGQAAYRAILTPHVKQIVREIAFKINESVPASVEGMPYARQWVLEETIKLLQESV